MSLWGAILVQTTTLDDSLGAIPAPGFLNSIKGNLLDGYAETPMQTHLDAVSVLCMLLVVYPRCCMLPSEAPCAGYSRPGVYLLFLFSWFGLIYFLEFEVLDFLSVLTHNQLCSLDMHCRRQI